MSVIGYWYSFALHMGVGRDEVDELLEVKVGDKTAWRGSVTSNQTVAIDEPNLFGGEKKEGGVQGDLTVLMGGPTQVAPSVMTTIFGALPGFRNVFTLFFDGRVTANNPYPKPWKMRYVRIFKGWDGEVWYPEKAQINLTRPVSQAESDAPSGNTTVTLTETTGAIAPGGTHVAGFGGADDGTILYVEQVAGYSAGDAENGIDSGLTYLVEGVDWSRVGDTFTFVNGTVGFLYITITYRASVTLAGGGFSGPGTTLIKAMNPAHVIYKCLTNRVWGRGLSRSKLDDASFRQTADTLFSENMGFCHRWSRRDEIEVFVQGVLDQIGGVLYEDRQSALLKLRLIRNDYSQSGLPIFTTSNGILAITEASISAAPKMINEVQVKYRDPVTNQDHVVKASNIAALQMANGANNVLVKEYPGAPTAEIATRLAKRDLRASAPGLRRFALTFDRRGSSLHPGGLVRIQDLPRNINDIVLRIASVDYGNARNGEIKVVGVEDVFNTPRRGIPTIGPNPWVPPNSDACVARYKVFEVPYRSMYKSLSTAELAFVDSSSAFVGALLERGQPLNVSFDMAVRAGAVEPEDVPVDDSYYCGYTPPP